MLSVMPVTGEASSHYHYHYTVRTYFSPSKTPSVESPIIAQNNLSQQTHLKTDYLGTSCPDSSCLELHQKLRPYLRDLIRRHEDP